MNLKIRNHHTDEVVAFVRDVGHTHPSWVHRQCTTTSEAELQTMLDGLDESLYVPGERDRCGIFLPDQQVTQRIVLDLNDLELAQFRRILEEAPRAAMNGSFIAKALTALEGHVNIENVDRLNAADDDRRAQALLAPHAHQPTPGNAEVCCAPGCGYLAYNRIHKGSLGSMLLSKRAS